MPTAYTQVAYKTHLHRVLTEDVTQVNTAPLPIRQRSVYTAGYVQQLTYMACTLHNKWEVTSLRVHIPAKRTLKPLGPWEVTPLIVEHVLKSFWQRSIYTLKLPGVWHRVDW